MAMATLGSHLRFLKTTAANTIPISMPPTKIISVLLEIPISGSRFANSTADFPVANALHIFAVPVKHNKAQLIHKITFANFCRIF